jgi:hypothetical protein
MPAQEEDDRVGDIPSLKYRVLSIEERMQVHQIRELERELLLCLDRIAKQKGGNTRPLSIAKTEIQTGVMWALRELTEES